MAGGDFQRRRRLSSLSGRRDDGIIARGSCRIDIAAR